jgi:hypothetical protein
MILDKCRSDRLAHATKLALDESLVDAFTPHRLGLDVKRVLQVTDTGVWVHQRSVVGLLLDESPSAGDRKR